MAKEPKTLLGGPYDDFKDGDMFGPTTGDAAILMQEFGIDPSGPLVPRWVALAQALAERYHPNFRSPPGRPKHKTRPYYAMLLGTIEDIKDRRGLPSHKAALRWTHKNCPALLVGNDRVRNIPSLEALYADFKTARSMKKNGLLW